MGAQNRVSYKTENSCVFVFVGWHLYLPHQMHSYLVSWIDLMSQILFHKAKIEKKGKLENK